MKTKVIIALLGTIALTACSQNSGVKSQLNSGDFGNATMQNHLVQTGQAEFANNLATRFSSEVTDTIYFGYNSATLNSTAKAILAQQANWIQQFPELKFNVYGHTDLTGGQGYNHELGRRRAMAVVDYLASQGVNRNRLAALVSHGEAQPAVNTSARERLNRRAVTEVDGFVRNHPRVLNGQYAEVIFREYVESATKETTVELSGNIANNE